MRNHSLPFGILVWALVLYPTTWGMFIVFRFGWIVAVALFIALALLCIFLLNYEKRENERQLAAAEERQRKLQDEYRKQMDFLRHLLIIVARIAKADGVVERSEVETALRIFDKYDVRPSDLVTLKQVFNDAIKSSDGLSIYEHASCIATHLQNIESRAFIYDLLWDVACADGVLAKTEEEILSGICKHLSLDPNLFMINYIRRRNTFVSEDEREQRKNSQKHASSHPHTDVSLVNDYAALGCQADASEEEIKAAYRKLAKSYHPDILRANHVPEDLIEIANKKMIAVNKAWERIQTFLHGSSEVK